MTKWITIVSYMILPDCYGPYWYFWQNFLKLNSNAVLLTFSFLTLRCFIGTLRHPKELLSYLGSLDMLNYMGSTVEVKWKLLSCVRLFAIPWTIQPMEVSRPEYWSGYQFPSPGDLPNPGIEPRSPEFQADSLPAESQGKTKNTAVGSLSLLQIFQTQESNQGLLHCRQILYQLIY